MLPPTLALTLTPTGPQARVSLSVCLSLLAPAPAPLLRWRSTRTSPKRRAAAAAAADARPLAPSIRTRFPVLSVFYKPLQSLDEMSNTVGEPVKLVRQASSWRAGVLVGEGVPTRERPLAVMPTPDPWRPSSKPLKRSCTLPASIRPPPPVLRQQSQSPNAKSPPANWGQALKAGLSDTVTPPALARQSSDTARPADASFHRRLTPPKEDSWPFSPLQVAAAAIGVTPALASARRAGATPTAAASLSDRDSSPSSATAEASRSRFVPRPELVKRQDTIDLLAQTLEGKMETKGHRAIFRDPAIEHDYRSGAFLESVATLRWWALLCGFLSCLSIVYAHGATEPTAHPPPVLIPERLIEL